MQQHSGQHLISAYFEKLLNIDTLSWWMADNQDMTKVGVSHIELDAENIDAGKNTSIIGLVLTVKITAGYPQMLHAVSDYKKRSYETRW